MLTKNQDKALNGSAQNMHFALPFSWNVADLQMSMKVKRVSHRVVWDGFPLTVSGGPKWGPGALDPGKSPFCSFGLKRAFLVQKVHLTPKM